jgi:hypothetical protein
MFWPPRSRAKLTNHGAEETTEDDGKGRSALLDIAKWLARAHEEHTENSNLNDSVAQALGLNLDSGLVVHVAVNCDWLVRALGSQLDLIDQYRIHGLVQIRERVH